MDIHIKRIKDTPYKLVCNGCELLGIFEHDLYVARDSMNEKQKHLVQQYIHALTLPERLDEVCDA